MAGAQIKKQANGVKTSGQRSTQGRVSRVIMSLLEINGSQSPRRWWEPNVCVCVCVSECIARWGGLGAINVTNENFIG